MIEDKLAKALQQFASDTKGIFLLRFNYCDVKVEELETIESYQELKDKIIDLENEIEELKDEINFLEEMNE